MKRYTNREDMGGGAVAKWIRMHLPSCGPWFESQAYHLRFYIVKFGTNPISQCVEKRTKMNKKRPDLASFKTTERGYLKRNRQTEKEEMKSRNIRIRIDKSFKVHFDN